jgi:hypothetical protein
MKLYDFYLKIENRNNKEFENFIKITFGYLIREKNCQNFTALLEKVSNY